MKQEYMMEAFQQAQKALNLNEMPVGAVIVRNNEIISTGYNQKENKQCCLFHAEIIAIQEASKKLNNWRLNDCDMYVTLEPCEMCAAAIKQARIKNIYSALSNDSKIIHNNVLNILQKDKSNPQVNLVNDLNKELSIKMLREFFYNNRKK